MLKRLRTLFQAKAASYHVNALHDARLAQALLNFVKGESKTTSDDPRYLIFIQKSKESDNQPLFLACCAYGLAEVNGRLDFILAAFYARLTGFQDKLKPDYFKTLSPQRFPFLSSWLIPLLGNYDGVMKHLDTNGIDSTNEELKLIILPALRFVQETNIAHNLKTIEDMKNRVKSHKGLEIAELSKDTFDPQFFEDQASNTQRNAIFWDRLYIKMIDFVSKFRKQEVYRS